MNPTRATPLSRRWLIESRLGFYEILLVTASALLYFLIRGNVVDRAVEAFVRGIAVVHLERTLGIFWELSLQSVVLKSMLLTKLFNYVYFWLHLPLILGFGLWLYLRHRDRYVVIRNAFLVSGGIGLLIYNLFPVAPPRLMPSFGFVDTMAIFSQVNYQAQSLRPFVNPFAAIPSLHFGWALLMSIGILMATRNRPLRIFAIVVPFAQFFAIIVTGNHFILDALVGGAVAMAGLGISLGMLHMGLVLPWERAAVQRAAAA